MVAQFGEFASNWALSEIVEEIGVRASCRAKPSASELGAFSVVIVRGVMGVVSSLEKKEVSPAIEFSRREFNSDFRLRVILARRDGASKALQFQYSRHFGAKPGDMGRSLRPMGGGLGTD